MFNFTALQIYRKMRKPHILQKQLTIEFLEGKYK